MIIEKFVKLNHQPGKRLDEQVKRIVSAGIMANTMSKRKALETNNLVRKRIKFVHKKTAKGEYNKKDGAPDAALLAALADINPHQQEPTVGGEAGTTNRPLRQLVAVAAPLVRADATLAVALEAIAPQQRHPTIGGIAATIHPNPAAIDPTPRVRSTTDMDPDTGTPTSRHWRHAVTPETDVKTVLVEGGLIHVRLMSGFKKGKHNN